MGRAMRHKIIGYTILTVVFFVLQTSSLSICRIWGFTPNFLLLLTVCVAFRESETFAAFYGLACGLLYDLTTQSTVGLRAAIYMFGAYFIAIAVRTVFRPYFLTYVGFALAALAVSLLFDYLFYLLLNGAYPFRQALRQIILPQFLIGGIWSYPVYYIIYRFHLSMQRRGVV